MAFKRRMRRRRRRLPETYTLRECRDCLNVYGSLTCGNPLIDVFEVLTMATPKTPAVGAPMVTSADKKFIVFDGMKFQSLWYHDPLTTQDCSLPNPTNPNATRMSFILTIWEALMVLPLAQGTPNSPAYLPVLTSGTLQAGDVADRVLWKRLSHLFVQGVNSIPSVFVVNPDSTARYNTESPVHVKSRARIDDRHGVFYVRNLVHDIFLPYAPHQPCNDIDCDTCTSSGSNNDSNQCGSIPITNDFWSKIFYHTRS